MNYAKGSFLDKNIDPEQLESFSKKIERVLGSKHPFFNEKIVQEEKVRCDQVRTLLRVLARRQDSDGLVQEISEIQKMFRTNFELSHLARSEKDSTYLIYIFEKKGISLFSNVIGELLKTCEQSEDIVDLDRLFELLDEKTEKLQSNHVNSCLNCVIKSKNPEKYKEQLRVYRDNLLKEELDPKNASVILKVSWFLGDLAQFSNKEEIEKTYKNDHFKRITYEHPETEESFLRLIDEIKLLDYDIGAIEKEYLLPGISVDRMMVVNGIPLYFEWDGERYHRDGGTSKNGWDEKTKAQRRLFEYIGIPMFYFSEKDWKNENFVRFQVLLDEFLEKHCKESFDKK